MEGDVIGRMRLDIADVQHKLGRVEAMMTRSMAAIEKKSAMSSQAMVKDTKNFMHVSRGAARTFSLDWWKRFGEVAIGFSIAYRAMTAAEAAVRGVVASFKIGLDAIDEFNMGVISIAASLQMLTEIPSKKSLEAYMKFGEVMFKKMEILAIRHFATGEQLQMAFTKMITLGIVPQTAQQLEAMAALVDRILMATRGLDAGRQIMTEIQAVVEGMQRPGAVVARELKSLVPHYKELIAAMRAEPDIAKRTEMFFGAIVKPLEAVSSVSNKIMETMQAWIASIRTAGTIMLRAGLDKMYIDIVGALKDMVGYLIDKNGLTEKGIALAYVYAASWESVKTAMLRVKDVGVTIGALYKAFTFNIPIMSNFLWALSSGVMALKYGLKSVIIMIDEIKKSFKMPGIKPFKEYFDEAFAELDKPTGSLLEYAKVNIQAWNKMYWAMAEASEKAHDDINASAGTMLERMGKQQEQLITDWNADLMKMKMPHEWLDPGKFEEFAERIRKTQSELTKELLAMLAELHKGTDKEDKESQKARLRKERQSLTLMSQMQKDYLVGRFNQTKASLDAEYELRVKKIEKLTALKSPDLDMPKLGEFTYETEGFDAYIQQLETRVQAGTMAISAYIAKSEQNLWNTLKHHTEEHFNWKEDEIRKDAEAMIAAGGRVEDVKAWALNREKDLTIEHNQHILENTTSLTEAMSASWQNYILKAKSALQQVAELSVELTQTFAQGVGNAYARALVYGEDLATGLRDLLKQMAASVISALIRIGVERLAQAIMHKILGTAEAVSRMTVLTAETFMATAASTAAIPIVGPAMAIPTATAVTSAALTSAASFGAIGGALGGSLGSFDEGGISTIPGIYYAGVPEAHIPLKDINAQGNQKPSVIIHMENPVFQDLETQKQVYAQMMAIIAAQVAPGAVIENYENDLEIRQMVKGGI